MSKMTGALNVEQQAAVTAAPGPVVIMAGPGTGKTKTLTARIAYLVEQEAIDPAAILALTFTNKAAREMQERVTARLGITAKPTITTFHALAAAQLTLPSEATLITDIERVAVLEVLAKSPRNEKKLKARDLGLTISRGKNLPPAVNRDPAEDQLIAAYDALLQEHDWYDYDDLLLRFYQALGQPDFVQKLSYRYILVDEFQDTNDLQYEIVKLLNSTDNLFVIGDPLQSIYGFRGSNAGVFDRFRHDYALAKVISLHINYRSAPQIVQAANAIFPDSPLTPFRSDAGSVQAVEVLNERAEADWIINRIEQAVGGSTMQRSSQHHGTGGRTFADFAVLTRTHIAARTIQRALATSGIPYQVVGEGSPYEQPHAVLIIQAFAYLVGLGEAPVVKELKASQVEQLLEPLKPEAQKLPLTQLADKIIAALLPADHPTARGAQQFTNTLVRYDAMTPPQYVAHVQQIAEQNYYDPAIGAVTVLTIHAAKGLEFPIVFLAGAEEGILPLARHGAVSDSEEEKRLFYVAVTRARDELYMLHARNRQSEKQELSRFVAALSPVVAERITDTDMAAQQKRLQKRAQKRAQSSLF
ncbi:MAG TPA: ATP-dependent helicase [Candidatus Saccharimonadales bacterium]